MTRADLSRALDVLSVAQVLSSKLQDAASLAGRLDVDVGLEDEAQALRSQLPELVAAAQRYRDYVDGRVADLREALMAEARGD